MKIRGTHRSIAPQSLPVVLGGQSGNKQAFRIASDIEVNCIHIVDQSTRAVIVSVDLLFVTANLRNAVLEGLSDLNILEDELFLAASHTHNAPAIDSTKPRLGNPDATYSDELAGIVIEAIRDAITGPMTEVTVHFSQAHSPIGVNRRRMRLIRLVRGHVEFNQVAMCPNPDGEIDPIVSVLEFRAGPKTLAYLWSAACHPTGLAHLQCIHSHFPGEMRKLFRSMTSKEGDFDNHIPVLFLQGFSGDVRPLGGKPKKRLLRRFVDRIRLGPYFSEMSEDEFSKWSDEVVWAVQDVVRNSVPISAEGLLRTKRLKYPASDFALGAEQLPPVSFHLLEFGNISIVGASAELVNGYAPIIRAMLPGRLVVPVGCIDHVIGYWPLNHMFKEGGYEVKHHCPAFGMTACHPEIEERVTRSFRSLIQTN